MVIPIPEFSARFLARFLVRFLTRFLANFFWSQDTVLQVRGDEKLQFYSPTRRRQLKNTSDRYFLDSLNTVVFSAALYLFSSCLLLLPSFLPGRWSTLEKGLKLFKQEEELRTATDVARQQYTSPSSSTLRNRCRS